MIDLNRLRAACESMGWHVTRGQYTLRIVANGETVRAYVFDQPHCQESQAFCWFVLEAMPKRTVIQWNAFSGKFYCSVLNEAERPVIDACRLSESDSRAESLLLAFCAWRESVGGEGQE